MNNRRRRKLKIAMDGLSTVMVLLNEIREEEETSCSNLPYTLIDSDMASQMEANIDVFNEIIEAIETALDEMEYM